MCMVSMIIDYGTNAPIEKWQNPYWVADFEYQLKKAKGIDDFLGQSDCELEEKKEALQKIADSMGVKIEFPE